MSVSVSMPQLGESVTEGTVTRWLKKEGERVEVDEPLLEVSTDKVDTEIPSPASGILRGIAVDEDETVAVGAQLAVIEDSESGDAAPASDDSASTEAAQPEASQAESSQPEAAQPEAAEPEPERSGSGSRPPARTAGVHSPTMRRPHHLPGRPRRGSPARPDRRRRRTLPRRRTFRRPRTASPSRVPLMPPRLPPTGSRRHRLPTASPPRRLPRPQPARHPRRASLPRPSRPRQVTQPRPTARARSTRRPHRCLPAPMPLTSPRWSASSPPSTP